MPTMDIKNDIKIYMQNVGIAARKASREMAAADTNSKNQALNFIAGAILREKSALLNANKQDCDSAKANGLDEAMLDRLTLPEKIYQRDGGRLAANRRSARPNRRNDRF
jgi:glutamate-5-semialdehyde dehydrogenase